MHFFRKGENVVRNLAFEFVFEALLILLFWPKSFSIRFSSSLELHKVMSFRGRPLIAMTSFMDDPLFFLEFK